MDIHVTPPTEETTEIVCILDRSGSMSHLTNKTIEGYNTFLTDQKAQPGKANWTLCLFDGGNYGWKSDHKPYEIIHDAVEINSIPELTKDTYIANGGTALFDALGKTITHVYEKVKNDPTVKVIFMIITDGEENESQEFKGPEGQKRIAEMVKERQDKDKWAFIFLGANIDSFSASGGLGMSAGNTMNFSASDAGMDFAYSNISKSTTMYRSFSKSDLIGNAVKMDDLISNNGEAKEDDLNK